MKLTKLFLAFCFVWIVGSAFLPVKKVVEVDFSTICELDRTMVERAVRYYEGTRRLEYPIVVMDTVYPIERAFHQRLAFDYAVKGDYGAPSGETVFFAKLLLREYGMKNKG